MNISIVMKITPRAIFINHSLKLGPNAYMDAVSISDFVAMHL